jgi:hypothetical protein
MNPEKDPPTHTAWAQYRDKGKFREWYKRGHVWFDKTPDGQIIGCIFEAVPTGPRGYDGFTYFFPNGMEPPPPKPRSEQPERPGSPRANEDEDILDIAAAPQPINTLAQNSYRCQNNHCVEMRPDCNAGQRIYSVAK